ncbi:MAG TPA: hypothetical protein VLT89_11065, partial [Usitatibacter sp.]|nr:hypothetical protein [Usitatibacter sp.]
DAQRTQQLPVPPQKPAPRAPAEGERTMKMQKLDPGFRPDATQQMNAPHERTQPPHERTQQLNTPHERTQRLDASPTTTQRIDPSPNTTQKLDPPAASQPPAGSAESTQRLDDSIWRLQEAKRMLQKIHNPK